MLFTVNLIAVPNRYIAISDYFMERDTESMIRWSLSVIPSRAHGVEITRVDQDHCGLGGLGWSCIGVFVLYNTHPE